jgi:outer membrane protein assembly factor BamA
LPFSLEGYRNNAHMDVFSNRNRRVFALLTAAFLGGMYTYPQSAGPKTYTLNRITATGLKHFSSDQIASASGLRKGQPVDMPAVDAAADRLFKSGAIAKIGYSFQMQGTSLNVEFQITEASQFLPCTYDNFVWFKDAELTAAIQREVPLFDGSLPVGGDMVNQVSVAIEHLLADHKITGKVIADFTGTLGGKATGYSIRVLDLSIPVKEVDVAGGPVATEALAMAEEPILKQNYSRAIAKGAAESGLTEIYQNEGYLQAKFSDPQVTMNDPQGADASQGVTVKFSVSPGPLYNWNGVSWTGIQVLGDSELVRLLGFKSGDIARRDRFQKGLAAIRAGYGKVGYLDVQISPTPEFDEPNHRVHYQMKVNEGLQYLMGEFTVTGVSEPLASKLKQAWKLRTGQVFDASYFRENWQKDMSEVMRTGPPGRGQFILNQTINRQAHVVDIELQFR